MLGVGDVTSYVPLAIRVMLVSFMTMSNPLTASLVLGSRVRFPLFSLWPVAFDGPSHRENHTNSPVDFEPTLLVKSDRIIGVVGFGGVFELVHVAAWAGLGLAAPQPTFASN